MMGAPNGAEARELGEMGVINVTHWSGGGEAASAWGATMTASAVEQRMGPLLGHADVLTRASDSSLIFALTNPRGDMAPFTHGRSLRPSCRLPAAVAAVESGVVDFYAIPEAHCDSRVSRDVHAYVREATKGGVRACTAAASRQVASIEASGTGEREGVNPCSGCIVLTSPTLMDAAVGLPKHACYSAGRMLHMAFLFEEGCLHVIVLYGVSAPSTRRKEWIATELSCRLTELICRIRKDWPNAAIVVFTDENAVSDPTDRSSGRLQRYDEAEFAPWRVMRANALQDVHRLCHGQMQVFTYVHHGVPCSRIDKVYADWEAVYWGDGQKGVKIATTTALEPLSSDHRTIFTQFKGPFTPRSKRTSGGVVIISSSVGPCRLTLSDGGKAKYIMQCAQPQRGLQATGAALLEATAAWPEVRSALDCLELGLVASADDIRHAAALMGRSAVCDTAERCLLQQCGPDGRYDLTAARSTACAALSTFMREAVPRLRAAAEAARAMHADTRKKDGGKTSMKDAAKHASIGTIQRLVERCYALGGPPPCVGAALTRASPRKGPRQSLLLGGNRRDLGLKPPKTVTGRLAA